MRTWGGFLCTAVLALLLAACGGDSPAGGGGGATTGQGATGGQATSAVTNTPRPTQPPREDPTPLPSAVDGGIITGGETLAVELPGGAPVDVTYRATGPTTISVSARALGDDTDGNPLDLVMEVLDANDEQLAYNDDHFSDRTDLGSSDSAIVALPLPTEGDYRIRLNAFNGAQSGRAEVALQTIDVNATATADAIALTEAAE